MQQHGVPGSPAGGALPLQVRTALSGPASLVVLSGRLDDGPSTDLLDAVIDQLLVREHPGVWSITLEMSKVEHVDAEGVEHLRQLQRTMLARGGTLAVLAPPSGLRRTLLLDRLATLRSAAMVED